ncbi:MAG: hypothetical protein WKG03_00725 [Telluria sp.]
MINNVPIKIMEASRNVARRHPNSIDCVVLRKKLLSPPGAEQMGGLPTMGGMGVLKSEDEPDFEYVQIGLGKVLVTGRFDGGDMTDRGDSIVPDLPMQEAQIVSADEVPGFEVKKGDLVGMMPGGGVLIGFEIVGSTGSVAIYPYVTKWIIAPRDELHDLAPWKS